jgi:DNA-3-methyladenine glycosylase I
MSDNIIRCDWCLKTDNYKQYHDTQWGTPAFDDATQFEFLVLEAAQAGLSWLTILNRRDGYRRAFADFKPEIIAKFTENDVERLMADTGIIRNRRKIVSAINNARVFLEIAAKHGSFSNYIWRFVDGKPIVNHWTDIFQNPAHTPLSEKMAKEFKRLGFTFLGKTVLYAHMQATGLVNDHIVSCFRHRECAEVAESIL